MKRTRDTLLFIENKWSFPQRVSFICVPRNLQECARSRFPVSVTYLSRTKSELAGSHRLMSRPDTCLGIRTHLSICGGMEHFIFR